MSSKQIFNVHIKFNFGNNFQIFTKIRKNKENIGHVRVVASGS